MRRITSALALLLGLSLTGGAQASLIGDEVNGELITVAPGFVGTFPVTTATVGPGVEFSRTFTFVVPDPDPFVELDVDANSFTFTFTNPLATGCPPSNPGCFFNLGLLGIELNGLDWVDNPDGEIIDVVPTSSTFPVGAITGVGFGPHNISVDFNQPVIPGFGTVWSASWDIVTSHSVPEPTTLALFAIALAGLGFARRRVH